MGKLFSGVTGSHDLERAGLFRVDDLLNSAVNRIRVIVVANTRSRVFPVHSDVAVPFRVPGCVKARRFE